MILSFIAGVISKLYDDLEDTNNLKEGTFKQTLLAFYCFIMAVISINDFNFTAGVFTEIGIINPLTNTLNSVEKGMTIAYSMFLPLSYHTATWPTIPEICFLGLMAVSAVIEPLFLKEEYGMTKLSSRSIGLIWLSGITYGASHYGLIGNSVQKLFVFVIGYVAMSVLFQFYMFFTDNYKPIEKSNGSISADQ